MYIQVTIINGSYTNHIPDALLNLPDLAEIGHLRNLREAAADGNELCAERRAE